jgi:hypothetical protein
VYDNQVLTANQIDVYHHDNNSGEITYVRSQPLPPADDRTVTLLSETELSDTQHPANIDYELVDGCVKDFRDFQRMTVSQDFTLMTIDNLIIGLEGGISASGIFDCEKSDEMVIQEIIDAFEMTEVFDSVYIERYRAELSLQQ